MNNKLLPIRFIVNTFSDSENVEIGLDMLNKMIETDTPTFNTVQGMVFYFGEYIKTPGYSIGSRRCESSIDSTDALIKSLKNTYIQEHIDAYKPIIIIIGEIGIQNVSKIFDEFGENGYIIGINSDIIENINYTNYIMKNNNRIMEVMAWIFDNIKEICHCSTSVNIKFSDDKWYV